MRFLISPNNQVETKFAVISHNRERFKCPNTTTPFANYLCYHCSLPTIANHPAQKSSLSQRKRAIARLSPHAITESSIGLVGCAFAPLWSCGDSEKRCPLRSEQSKLPQRATPGFDPTASVKEPDSFLWEILFPPFIFLYPQHPCLLTSFLLFSLIPCLLNFLRPQFYSSWTLALLKLLTCVFAKPLSFSYLTLHSNNFTTQTPFQIFPNLKKIQLFFFSSV